jgi:hypothetical protein
VNTQRVAVAQEARAATPEVPLQARAVPAAKVGPTVEVARAAAKAVPLSPALAPEPEAVRTVEVRAAQVEP